MRAVPGSLPITEQASSLSCDIRDTEIIAFPDIAASSSRESTGALSPLTSPGRVQSVVSLSLFPPDRVG